MKEPGKAALLVLAERMKKPEPKPAEETSSAGSEAEQAAVEELAGAMEAKDYAAGAKALKAFLTACGVYDNAEEKAEPAA